MRFLRLFMTHPDLAIEFVISALIAILVARAVPGIVNSYYDNVESGHVNDVGLEANDQTVPANSIEDILNNDTFAIVVSDPDEYKFDGSAYWKDEDPSEIYNVKLASGERVAVRMQAEYLKKTGDGYLLNIGKIKKFDLTAEPEILDELQEEYALDRTDFYVDLRTNIEEGSKYSEATRQKMIDLVQPFTAIFVCAALWILLHVITVKLALHRNYLGTDRYLQGVV